MAAKTPRAIFPEVCVQALQNVCLSESHADGPKGLFAGTVGVRRLLKLFAKYDIKTTWFIPGHSLETFPEECAMIRDAGHEMYRDYIITRRRGLG